MVNRAPISRKSFCSLLAALLILLPVSSTAQDPTTPPTVEPGPAPSVAEGAAEENKFTVHGFWSTRYRFRTSDLDDDSDLYQYIGLDTGDSVASRVRGHFLARAALDTDGGTQSKGFNTFDDVVDTHGSDLDARIYHAYADITGCGPVQRVRVGRQQMYETPVANYFDGARVDSERWSAAGDMTATVYTGIPVHLFESSSSGDFIIGAYVHARPWRGGRMQLHWTHVEDEARFTDESNDLYAARVWQRLGPYVHVHGAYTRLEGEDRDVLGRIGFYHPEHRVRAQASYFQLLESQRELAINFDAYFASAFEYFPYRQIRVVTSKGFGERFGVDAGLDVREMVDDANESSLNHEFHRYYISPHCQDWPVKGLGISLTAEVWDTKLRPGDTRSVSGDVSYEIDEMWKVSLGTAYSLYKYDYFQNFERDDVRTYYAGVQFSPKKAWRLNARYAYEDDDFDQYQQLRLEIRYRF